MDIWGVGWLIFESKALGISMELRDMGMWMQDAAPSAREALDKIKEYQLSRQ
ncbi:MAG TPA: hypothetical protein VGO47_00845 [Chlamydiales bacterium]|nr:hypothetical protein [Chlamydiales bacterium]